MTGVLILTTMLGVLFSHSASAEPKSADDRSRGKTPRILTLGKGDLTLAGCSKSSVVRPGVCFWGHKERADCTGECSHAIIEGFDAVRLICGLTAEGIVVDENNQPLSGMTVELILLGRTRFITQTNEQGRFRLSALVKTSEPDEEPCLVRKNLGKMPTERGNEKIVLVADPSQEFTTRTKDLRLSEVSAAEFTGQTILQIPDDSRMQ